MQTNITQLQDVRNQIEVLAKKNKNIHVTIQNRRSKVKNAPAKITGIYERFLCVESLVNNYLEKFTINYIDLLTSNTIIKELD